MKTKKGHIYKNPQRKIKELQRELEQTRQWGRAELKEKVNVKEENIRLSNEITKLKSLANQVYWTSYRGSFEISIDCGKDSSSLKNRIIGEEVICVGKISKLIVSEDEENKVFIRIKDFYLPKGSKQ